MGKQRKKSREQYEQSGQKYREFRDSIDNPRGLSIEYVTNEYYKRIAKKTRAGNSCKPWNSRFLHRDTFRKKLPEAYFPYFWYSSDQVFVNEGCLDCCTNVKDENDLGDGEGVW